MRGLLSGAVVGAVCVAQLVACSSDEKKKPADAGPDSNNADGAAATAGTGGSAGADASAGAGGTAGSAGVAGTGGSAGADASAGAAGIGGSAGSDAGLVCSPMFDLDAGMAGAAGTDGGMDGSAGAAGASDAAVPNGYKWHDWANNVCGDCVGRVLACADFAGGTFDPATGILTLQLNPGVAEVVDALVQNVYWYTNDLDASVTAGSLNAPAVMQVDKNTLTVDLSADVPSYASHVGSIEVLLRDACGVTSDIPYMATLDADGGTVFPIYCEF